MPRTNRRTSRIRLRTNRRTSIRVVSAGNGAGRLPSGFRDKAAEYLKKAQEKMPEDLKKQASDYALDKIPTDNNFLTGVAVFTGVTGVIFLLQGLWARYSAASFQKIVDTRGNDVSNLMEAVGSLQSMDGTGRSICCS
jgi:hypothetical protein